MTAISRYPDQKRQRYPTEIIRAFNYRCRHIPPIITPATLADY